MISFEEDKRIAPAKIGPDSLARRPFLKSNPFFILANHFLTRFHTDRWPSFDETRECRDSLCDK
jgi:hypothetical protein